MNTFLKYAGILAILYAAVIATMYMLQNSLIFKPDKKYYTFEDVGTQSYTEITVITSDAITLKGWYAPAKPAKKTILFFHGNASTWQWRARDFEYFINQGYGVLLAGYRGYGSNAGSPSEEGFYKDAEAYFAFLTIGNNIPHTDIVLYGESLGTGVAVELAYRYRTIGGLVLEAPYASITEVASTHYPFVPGMHKLVKNKFESVYKIGQLTMPKLFLLAEKDRTILPQQSQRLLENAPQPKSVKIYKQASHNDIRQMGGLADTAKFLAFIHNN